jgi:hypothetical protein
MREGVIPEIKSVCNPHPEQTHLFGIEPAAVDKLLSDDESNRRRMMPKECAVNAFRNSVAILTVGAAGSGDRQIVDRDAEEFLLRRQECECENEGEKKEKDAVAHH